MMKFPAVLVAMFLVLALTAQADSLDVSVQISPNNIVTEHYVVEFQADQSYEEVDFLLAEKPLSIISDNEYTIFPQQGASLIVFKKTIVPGTNMLEFSALYESKVQDSANGAVFRSHYLSENVENTKITVSLPPFAILAEEEPQTIPEPASITSDGQHILVHWEFAEQDESSIVIFFQKQETGSVWSWILIGIILIAVFGSWIYFKRKSRTAIHETLSSEERKVVEEIRKGVRTQKEVMKNLGFSKSKMSKVVLKLEKKNLVEKESFFKTNILKLSGKIK